MSERLTPDDVLDDISRQRLRSVLVIGITAHNTLIVRSNLTARDEMELAEIVSDGHAIDKATVEYIRSLDA